MATYYHGAPEIHSDGLQTLYLMNPCYVGYSEASGAPANMVLYNSNMNSVNPISLSPTTSHQQHQHFVGIPIQQPENSHRPAIDHSTLNGLAPRIHYNLWNPAPPNSSVGRGTAVHPPQQGLSLSLSPHQTLYGTEIPAQVPEISPAVTAEGMKLIGPSSTAPAGPGGLESVLMNSKYLKAAQELLDEVVSVGKLVGGESSKKEEAKGPMKGSRELELKGEGESSGKRQVELTMAEKQELQMKKAKLVSMLDEVEQRYRQYHLQMQIVVCSFEAVVGHGSARTYTALALQTISKQFRCLRDAISCQIKVTSNTMGEEDCAVGVSKSIGCRLRLVDHHLRQQRALQHLGMIQHNAWRPQRGLPERAVSILRAWLFENFLHPYPKDSDKLMLAKQTGLTRSQVSNWFINARVRLWKPMVEEMYVEEMKEQEQSKLDEKSSNKGEDEASSLTRTEQDKPNESNHSSIAIPATNYGVSQNPNDELIMQPLLKKARSNKSPHLNSLAHSMSIEMKPEEIRNRELLLKFMEARSNPYSIGEIGRFNPQQFAPSFQGNGVSLTLGLPHSESLSLSGEEPPFLSGESLPMGGGRMDIADQANVFCGLHNHHPQASHPSNGYESIEIQNRKRFAIQLLPDFVA